MPRSFKLLETLGEGAFGAVHLAEVHGDEGFVQTLAVKCLHPQWSGDAELVGRLRDEARLLALLSHDNVVRVHGLTRLGGRLAILMEPVDGVDLSRTGGDPVPPRVAVEIVGSVADALDAAWRAVPPGQEEPLRVVHRDIKPSNVMVTPRGGVKVMDFGVARATFDAREAHTRSQQFGTARYMAPERWLDGVAEAPSDVFSLGLTLIELVSGAPIERPRLSRAGFHEDMQAALDRLDAWPGIRELAGRMVAFSPEDRPTSADVVSACHALLEELPAPGLRVWAGPWVETHRRRRRSSDEVSVVDEDASAETFDFAAPPPGDAATLDQRSVGILTGVGGTLLVAASAVAIWLLLFGPPIAPTPPRPTEVARVDASPAPPPPEPPAVEDDRPTPAASGFSAAPGLRVPNPRADDAPPTPEPTVDGPAGGTPEPDAPSTPPDAEAATAPDVDETGGADEADDDPPTGLVTFVVEPSDLELSWARGVIRPRRAVALPRGVVPVTVRDGEREWTCAVYVEASTATYRVDRERCARAN